ASSFNTGGGVSCCWIMIYGNGGSLPWFVRRARDVAYKRDKRIVIGYTWMSSWLVPLMLLFPWLESLVKPMLVQTLTEHASYISCVKGCRSRVVYQRFWFSVWKFIGDRI